MEGNGSGVQKPNHKTAGSRLVENVPVARIGDRIGDIESMLTRNAGSLNTIDYIYVLDKSDVLVGVITIKEIFRAPKKTIPVENLMKRQLVSVHPTAPQERVVYLALSHGIKAIPVVDKEGRLMGVVPYDTILQIFHHEVHEDTLMLGGIFHKVGSEYTKHDSSSFHMVKSRLPWLIIGIMGGLVAASIVGLFEEVLETFIVLASFIPVLVYISGAAGAQSSALIIRALAIDPKINVARYIFREAVIGFTLGLCSGAFLGLATYVVWKIPLLGMIVGASIFVGMMVSIFISTTLPLLFRKIKMDPAIATGPFATMLTDIITLFIYFGIAIALIGYFGLPLA
ncbi:MAG: magnesium transporter [Candidatus Aenigmarchaeota archaeon]|nr:magnesium transporter [Candidatus Aenigmarchaeota archaeon]